MFKVWRGATISSRPAALLAVRMGSNSALLRCLIPLPAKNKP